MDTIANKYRLLEKIGSGSFGEIYKGVNIRTKELVAIKVEPILSGIQSLKNEARIYQYLNECKSIPKLKWFGTYNDKYYMVIDLFGNSIYEIIKSGTRFSLNDTIQIGLQMIDILKSIHEKGLLHRDIKPDNFLFDISSNNIILIDFGLCKKFIKDDGSHIEMKSTFNIIGSINYCSVNSHHLFELSRRDDLESLGNALIYINMGILPWSKLNTKEIIKECKINCIPKFFIPYFDYVRKLEFNEKPDYDLLKTILSNVKYKI
jgi:serine/threonine protein kinase